MKDVPTLIKAYLQQGRMMQIATVNNGQPWICTVYYAADANQDIYWLSLPERRHSKELAAHKKVAIAIPIKFDKPVVGLQAEGSAQAVTEPKEIARAMELYTERYDAGRDFYNNFLAGKNEHVLYRFTPKLFVLFDEMNFDRSESRKEWRIG